MRLLVRFARLGYEIENQRDAKGRDAGFEIHGVPQELLAKFSQRSRQRDEAIAAFVEQHGRKPTRQRGRRAGSRISGRQAH